MSKKSLYPALEPVTINPQGFIFWIFVFALFFFILGVMTQHYPNIEGVI